LAWVADSTHLVAAYGSSRVTSVSADYGFGTCVGSAAAKVVVVAALKSQPGLDGPSAAADPRCEVSAVTATSTGYAAIEGCGAKADYLSGPVRLIRYSAQLSETTTTTLGRCVDGAELRSDATGTVLLGSTYQFCNPPGKPGPRTIAFTDRTRRLVTFYAKPNGGEDAFSSLSW
jgi:hypothetical protein